MQHITVLGLGKVGQLVAILLQRAGFKVTGVDSKIPAVKVPYKTQTADLTQAADLKRVLKGAEAVVSCLPFYLNKNVATAAVAASVHYFDLTEDVPTTDYIMGLSKKAKTLLAPQCGLAPGLIGMIGAHLASQFDALRSIELKVGALPAHPKGGLGYACTWSPAGVVNEYIKDCEVIYNGQKKRVPPLEGLESVAIHGMALEAFTTAGGLGTMCDTYAGVVGQLTYKTMRYPGHCQYMKFLLEEMHLREQPELAVELLENACPPVPEDVVYVYASVTGLLENKLNTDQFVAAYRPLEIDGQTWRAIAWTTAASVVGVVELVARGKLPKRGFLKQEQIPLEQLLATSSGQLFQVGQGA